MVTSPIHPKVVPDDPQELKQELRQPRSMPSLGAMLYPEIGLAGAITGEGAFRQHFERSRRQSIRQSSRQLVGSSSSGPLPDMSLRSDLLECSFRSESLDEHSGERAALAAHGVGVRSAAAGSRIAAAAASRIDAARACAPSQPGRRKFVVNANPEAKGKHAKGRFVIKDQDSTKAANVVNWGQAITGPVDKRQGTLVSRAPRRKFEVKELVAKQPAALSAASPETAAGATRDRAGWPRGGPNGPTASPPNPVVAASKGERLPVDRRREPTESALVQLCKDAGCNTALLEAWSRGGGQAPASHAMLLALLAAQRDMLMAENAALRQLNGLLRQAKGERRPAPVPDSGRAR